MAAFVPENGNGTNITGTTTVRTGSGTLLGIFVSSSSSGTLKVQDGSTTLVNTFSGAAATFYRLPLAFTTSLVITVGGTIDCCVIWSAP